MKILSQTTYKSLIEEISIELPDLTVLTGINGSGKTHLLSGLACGQISLIDNNGALISTGHMKYIPSFALIPNDTPVVQPAQLNRQPLDIWNNCQAVQQHSQRNLRFEDRLQQLQNPRARQIIQYIMSVTGKSGDNLTASDFLEYFPLDDRERDRDLFKHNLANVFHRYYLRYEKNEYDKFLHHSGKGATFLTDEEFLRRHGEAPWTVVNKILDEAKLGYHVNSPMDSHREAPFELKLIHATNKAEIQFSELSSGEKVLMSLALALYHSNSNSDLEFPKVLLLDEPDASLHPSMSRQFLDVIRNVFIRDKVTKVIMTTHSPSTVALAHEDSLFVMNRTEPRIQKTTKDRALRVLTAGVPSFSVNYENRRQVFVESKYDVFFYEKTYEKLRAKLTGEISLTFISSGVGGSGNCDQVKEIVEKLSGFGNKFIFGIIDWDCKNTTRGHVKVIGEHTRYSIENYIFDPSLIAAFLLREKIIQRADLGLQTENYTDFKHLSHAQLQSVADYLTNRLEQKVGPTDRSKVKVIYVNTVEIEVPKWYLLLHGHTLEAHLKSAFPRLNKYKGEGDLKKAVIETIIDDVPELIPQELLDLFRQIQEH